MIERTFVTIEGFDRYGVSDDGVVVNLHRNSILKPQYDASGYRRVVLQSGGLRWSAKVIELVAKAYMANVHPDDKFYNISNDRSDASIGNIKVVCTHLLVTAFGTNKNYGTIYDVAKKFSITVDDVKLIIARRKKDWDGPAFDYINTVSR